MFGGSTWVQELQQPLKNWWRRTRARIILLNNSYAMALTALSTLKQRMEDNVAIEQHSIFALDRWLTDVCVASCFVVESRVVVPLTRLVTHSETHRYPTFIINTKSRTNISFQSTVPFGVISIPQLKGCPHVCFHPWSFFNIVPDLQELLCNLELPNSCN